MGGLAVADKLSKHELLSKWIEENIANKTYSPGTKIPSENELATMFAISRQTVRQSIGNLVSKGILIREQGSGTYVNNSMIVPTFKETKRIGVITTYLDDYIFPTIIHGIEEVLTSNGYTLTLGITHNKTSDEENCLLKMMQGGIDGLIIEGTKTALPNTNASLYNKLSESKIPMVFINGFYNDYNGSYVVMDDVKAGETLTNILIEKGHERIAGIFKSDDIQGLKRYEGMQKSLKNHNIHRDDSLILWYTTEDFKYLFGGNMDKIILERFKGVTAIVCYNDLVAAELIQLLKRNNLSVPEDISLVSFDNSFLAKQIVYNLTSAVYPFKKIGKKSAQLLLASIQNSQLIEQINLVPSIKLRGSIKKIQG
jgi:GntR family transcriptional regulator, arabinose operon transcriptional repressor